MIQFSVGEIAIYKCDSAPASLQGALVQIDSHLLQFLSQEKISKEWEIVTGYKVSFPLVFSCAPNTALPSQLHKLTDPDVEMELSEEKGEAA